MPEAPTTGIPVTYVPARNTIMLSLALAWAEVLGAQDIFIGVNVLDFERLSRIAARIHRRVRARSPALATKAGVEGSPCRIHAPLIALTKAEIIREGTRLGVDYAQTVSCYQADDAGPRLRPLRFLPAAARAGSSPAGLPDPTRYR